LPAQIDNASSTKKIWSAFCGENLSKSRPDRERLLIVQLQPEVLPHDGQA
jgi:hypothetical protein